MKLHLKIKVLRGVLSMPNTALAFAFCDGDSDTDEMTRFVCNTDSKELSRLMDITKEALNSIAQFTRDDSLRLVICSSKYIRKVKRYCRYVDNKLDGITESMCCRIKPSIAIAYSVKSDNKILKLLPKEISNNLTPRVTVVFVEYDKDPNANDDDPHVMNFLHMINIAVGTLMHLLDKMIENSVIKHTENPDGAKSRQLKDCLDAYKEYRYSKLNSTMSVELVEELSENIKKSKMARRYSSVIRSSKINGYMSEVVRSINTHKITDSTFNYFARAVGNTAILSKMRLRSESEPGDFEKSRYRDLAVEELEEMGDIYFDAIHRMLFGNFDITEYVNKLKVSERAVYAINRKLESIR